VDVFLGHSVYIYLYTYEIVDILVHQNKAFKRDWN